MFKKYLTNFLLSIRSKLLFCLLLLLLNSFAIVSPKPIEAAETINLVDFMARNDFTPHGLSTGESITYRNGGGGIRLYKNSNYEQLIVKSDGIYRREDTSWAPLPGFKAALCTNGNRALYTLNNGCTQYSEGQEVTADGVWWAPITAEVGESWQTPAHQIVTIDATVKDGESDYNLPPLKYCSLSNLSGYQHPAACNQSQEIKLIAHYKKNEFTFCTGATNPEEMIVIKTLSGAGAGDTYYFMKGWGMVGFEAPGLTAGLASGPGVRPGKMHPNECSGKTSTAETYIPKDQENYNYYPLIFRPEKYLGEEKNLKNVLIWNLVRDQGYEVHCASKEWKIEKDVWGEIVKFFELYPGQEVTLSGDAEYKADMVAAKIPMFRGNEIEYQTSKVSSLEGYFGAIDRNYTDNPINSGVVNSLLSIESQCQFKLEKLKSVEEICTKLKNPNKCFLNQKIPDTDLHEWELWGEIIDAYDTPGKHICQDLTREKSEEGVASQQFNSIKDGLDKMSLNMENVYRLAFLVISIKQNPNASNDDDFWFYKEAGKTDKHVPIIIAFKIPDFATNGSNSLAYRDTAHLTAQTLRTIEEEEMAFQQTEEKRDGFLKDIRRRQQDLEENIFLDDIIIDCRGMDECETGEEGELALKKAIIDIVNGSANTCSDVGPFEKAGDVFTYSHVDSETREFGANGGYKDPFISDDFNDRKNPEFEWGLTFSSVDEAKQALDPQLTVRAHIVAPIGADIEYINTSLRVFFDDAGYNALVENNCVVDSGECGLIPEYYTLQGGLLDLTSDNLEKKFDDYKDQECVTVVKEVPLGSGNFVDVQECGPKEKEFGVSLKESGGDLYFPGASLGWHVQKIQETLRPIGSRAHSYILSCERAEDMFLGRCPGGEFEEINIDDLVANYTSGVCLQIDRNSQLFRDCVLCDANNGIWTGLGCVKTEGRSIVEMILSVGLSMGGGFTLMIILFSGAQLSISEGDPKKIEDAKNRITAAIIGLIFIILSVVILQFVGVKILRIPGFGG